MNACVTWEEFLTAVRRRAFANRRISFPQMLEIFDLYMVASRDGE